MRNITAYNKFIVAIVGLAVTVGFLDEGVSQDVAAILTCLGVFLFPNQD